MNFERKVEEAKIANYLIETVEKKASGRSEEECLRNLPRDVYFVGNLRPLGENLTEANRLNVPVYLSDLSRKLSPVAFGAEFRVLPIKDSFEVRVELTWACYYKVFPTFAQQYAQMSDKNLPKNGLKKREHSTSEEEVELDDMSIEDETLFKEEISKQFNRENSRTKDVLFTRFKKIECKAQGIVKFNLEDKDEWSFDSTDIDTSIFQELERAQDIVLRDSSRFRTNRGVDDKVRVPNESLTDEKTFDSFLVSLKTDVVPDWKWKLNIKVEEDSYDLEERGLILSFEFTNASLIPENAYNREGYFFDVQARFRLVKCEILPFELDLAPRDFRYDRHLWGNGFNCALKPVSEAEHRPSEFITKILPLYNQRQIETNNEPIATFSELSDSPIPVLEKILDSMKEYLKTWNDEKNLHLQDKSWNREKDREFLKSLGSYKSEINRFERGLNLLKENKDLLLAFKLTNETFMEGGNRSVPKKKQWRLFQIVFLVSQIPWIASLNSNDEKDVNELEYVDVIYFPTGGGKTEAYLGVVVLNCFFDRLRGKTAGVTAWTRFPLRLLTVQQTQRFADIIGMAEVIRSQHTDVRLSGKNVDGFAVGYFVGKEASPNQIEPPEQNKLNPEWSRATDPNARQNWKKITRCPYCKTKSVSVDFDKDEVRLFHRCTNQHCIFPNGVIPVYIVDNEIFRYLPSVIVGTIDKLASLGNQRKMVQIFGQLDGVCKKHGYFKGTCTQKKCDKENLDYKKPSGISAPTLFVQDELHLLKEGLGTFDSHYETFVQTLYKEFNQEKPLKVIASSATIEAFGRQIEHLYGRTKSRIFPSPGPTLQESFYIHTNEWPQRIFAGVMPHNKTIFNAILSLIRIYHETIQDLQNLKEDSINPYGGDLSPGTVEWTKFLLDYNTSLVYFKSLRELSAVPTDVNTAVSTGLEKDGYHGLALAELTGQTSSELITNVLETLEAQAETGKITIDLLMATSTISHGVDIDSLNTMIFYGMPLINAEYIQASSRVGRLHTGIVFDCFHPAKERDQSYYLYFVKYHEFLGRMVEPVAINRWSKFSIHRTLPGLFMSILLQVISNKFPKESPNKFYMLEFVKKKITSGEITEDDFIPILKDSYLVGNGNEIGKSSFEIEIKGKVRFFLDQISGASSQTLYVSDALIPRPMRSLRDVDEQVDIQLDELGSIWGDKNRRRAK